MRVVMWIIISLLAILFSCRHSAEDQSIEFISDVRLQDSVFKKLVTLTGNSIHEHNRDDSLSFLILPMQAACPYCRKKTIDSIAIHEHDLPERHYVIITGNMSRKIVGSYFKDQDHDLPDKSNVFFIDSTNLAADYALCEDKPTMYYTSNRRAYQKVASTPKTVREDLHRFFSRK